MNGQLAEEVQQVHLLSNNLAVERIDMSMSLETNQIESRQSE